MKETIKQLKKEIEIEQEKRPIRCFAEAMKYGGSQDNERCKMLKIKLQTLQEVCKEIDKQIDNYKKLNKKFPKNQTFVDMWTALFALQLRLEGEENV